MMVPPIFRRVFTILLLPIVMACAQTRDWVTAKLPGQAPAPAGEVSPPSGPSVHLARLHMQAGAYQEAIDVYDAVYQKQPHDQALLKEYAESIEYMAASADQALGRQDTGGAGKIYHVLLRNIARFEGFDAKLSFTRSGLNDKLAYCKKTLFQQGFQEYREGNLNQAIAVWQDLLVIDPHNKDIQEALKTARTQQRNLQEQE